MTQPLGSLQGLRLMTQTVRAEVCKLLLLFALIWVVLTQGALHSWVIGIIVVPLATWAAVSLQLSVSVQQNPSVKITGLVRFLPFFFWQSLCGGWVTAMFAIQPRRQLMPGFVSFRTRLPDGRPRLYFLHIISLLPGTVSADIDGQNIEIHVLNTEDNHQKALTGCEQQVGVLFGLRLESLDNHVNPAGRGLTDRNAAL